MELHQRVKQLSFIKSLSSNVDIFPSKTMANKNHLGFFLVSALYLLITFLTFNQIEEDAFIYFRLAENIASGHGYVFNQIGERIESGSGPIWLFLLVLMAKLPINMVVSVKFLGILFALLSLKLMMEISKLSIRNEFRIFPALLLSISIPFYSWAQRGLESPLYIFSLLLFCFMLLDQKFREKSWIAAILVLLCRPEAFFLLIFMLVLLAVFGKNEFPIKKNLMVVIGVEIIVTLIRFAYFQDFLPQPFYHKMRTTVGFDPLILFAKENYLMFLIVPAMVGWFKNRGQQNLFEFDKVVLAIFIPTFVWSIFGEDIIKPYNRHLLPALPFFYLWSLYHISRLAIKGTFIRLLQAGLICLAILTLFFASSVVNFSYLDLNPVKKSLPLFLNQPVTYLLDTYNLISSGEDSEKTILPTFGADDQPGRNFQATTGKFLAQNYPQGTTFVYSQMGQTPWYAGNDISFTDSLGLTSRKIGYAMFNKKASESIALSVYEFLFSKVLCFFHLNKHPFIERHKHDTDIIFESRPDVIILHEFILMNKTSSDSRLMVDKRFEDNYKEKFVINNFVRLFERKDFRHLQPLAVPEGASVVAVE